MKKIEYKDPVELANEKGATVQIRPIPSKLVGTLSKDAIDVWNFSKRRIIDANGKVVMPYADTMTNAFANKIDEFLSDPEHIESKFEGKRPTDNTMASRAGFSRATWNRLTGAIYLDIERGNAFAVAIALKLDEKQTEELLYSAGFVLNYEHELDSAIMYFIKKGEYDINVIKAALSQFCDVKNGFDNFTFLPRPTKKK
jgi:hypothetical protein